MKPASISFFCSLLTTLAAAAPRKRSGIKHIPSFIPPSNPRQQVVKIKQANPLLLRGGQQGVTSTSQHAIFESASTFIQYNSILASINMLGMGISLAFPRVQYHLDLLGTGAFGLASIFCVFNGITDLPLRVQVSSIAVVIWSVKLASFLFFRACKVKTDTRLDGMLSTVTGTISFWILSFLWGAISSLPHSLGIASTSPGNQNGLLLGTIIYIIGLSTESIADYQKWSWKQSHPGKFCNSGLWSISQHPNFYGNFLIWSGITVMNVPALIDPISCDGSFIVQAAAAVWSCRKAAVALVSPAFLWLFFNGQARGDIASGVEESMKRYGDDAEFREYIKSVPLLVPDLRRIFGFKN